MIKTKFKFDFISLMLVFTLIISGNKKIYISLLSAIVHELGHIAASKIMGIKLCEMKFGMLGARLKTSSQIYSYKQEIVLCVFGPLFNFFSAILVVLGIKIFEYKNEDPLFFIVSSLFLGVLNLLPIYSFDGGRIFESTVSYFISPIVAERSIKLLSFFTVFFLWCISVYFLLIYSTSLSLFIFSASLFCFIFVFDK